MRVSPAAISPGSDATFTISASSVNPNQIVAVQYFLSGRAIFGTEYTVDGPPGEADIPAGSSSTTVVLHAVPNIPMHRGEKVILNLAGGAGYKVSKPNRATVTIR